MSPQGTGSRVILFGGAWKVTDAVGASQWYQTDELWFLDIELAPSVGSADTSASNVKFRGLWSRPRNSSAGGPASPHPRAAHTTTELVCGPDRATLVVVGGQHKADDGGWRSFSDVWHLAVGADRTIRWTSLPVSAGLLIRARARHTASFLGAENGTARVLVHGGEYKSNAGWTPMGDDWTLRVPLECNGTDGDGDGVGGGGGDSLGPTVSWVPLTSEEDGGAIVNDDDAAPCCLIAGATDGIGYAFYEAALRQGCRSWLAADMVPPTQVTTTRPVDGVVYAIGRDFSRVDTAAVMTANRLVVRRLRCDVQVDAQIVACVAALGGKRIDTFVNCIGTFHKGKVVEATEQLVQSHFDLNCVANIRLTQAVR